MSTGTAAATGWRNPRRLFHVASYLQYPFMLLALIYVARPYFNGFGSIFGDFNLALLHAGVAIGFSSLQDPTTTQNEMSRRVWEDPRKGSLAIAAISAAVVLALGGGLAALYLAGDSRWSQLAMGLVSLGLGMFISYLLSLREKTTAEVEATSGPNETAPVVWQNVA